MSSALLRAGDDGVGGTTTLRHQPSSAAEMPHPGRHDKLDDEWDGRRAVAGEILDELHPLPPLHVAGKVVERVVRVCLRRSARMRSTVASRCALVRSVASGLPTSQAPRSRRRALPTSRARHGPRPTRWRRSAGGNGVKQEGERGRGVRMGDVAGNAPAASRRARRRHGRAQSLRGALGASARGHDSCTTKSGSRTAW